MVLAIRRVGYPLVCLLVASFLCLSPTRLCGVEPTAAGLDMRDLGLKQNWQAPVFDDTAWRTMKCPVMWENTEVGEVDGTIWFRKSIDVPAAWAGKDLLLHLGFIDDIDVTYWNGLKVGSTHVFEQPRDYRIAGDLVKPGRTVITVRITDAGGGGGFNSKEALRVERVDDPAQKIDLTGEWRYRRGSNFMTEPYYVKPAGVRVVINDVTRNDKPSTAAVVLAENGQAKLPIVISPQASEEIKVVAADLAKYLGKMTSAEFKIEPGNGVTGIVLGNVKDFPNPSLGKALETFNIYDGKEAFAIRTTPNRIQLVGNTDLGASHAAYRLLRTLGCRWYFPHEAWEVIPKSTKLTFQRDISDRPQILVRNIWFQAGAWSDYLNWKRFNSQTESFLMDNQQGGITRAQAIYADEFDFAKHPEYHPLIKQPDGTMKRTQGTYQLEFGNPRVRKLIVDATVDFFKKNPTKDMVSFEPADMPIVSQSPESQKLGSYSDIIFGLANEAARAVQKEFPGQNKMLGTLAYNHTYEPPSFKLEPNVHVALTSAGVGGELTEFERFYTWRERSSNLGSYEYYSVWAWTEDGLPPGYPADLVEIKRHVHNDLVVNGLNAVSAESTDSWGNNGLGYYAATALMWNADLSMKELLDDFFNTAFGPAAGPMRNYYDRLDPHNHVIVDGHLLGLCFQDLDKAGKLAANLPDVQARIDYLKLYMRYIYLRWVLRHPGVRGQSENGDRIMEVLNRTQRYGLLTFPMVSQYFGSPGYAAGQRPTGRISTTCCFTSPKARARSSTASIGTATPRRTRTK